MLGRLRLDVDTAIEHYDNLAKNVFSDEKLWGEGTYRAEKLEKAIKSVVNEATGDSESLLTEGDQPGVRVCRT
jgi:hypothetical protein